MPGYSDYTAKFVLNLLLQTAEPPIINGIWIGLFVVPPADDGSGGVEVSGNGYSRVQVAGITGSNAVIAPGVPTLAFVETPPWVVNGMTVFNITTPSSIPFGTTVVDTTSTTVTMSQNVSGPGIGYGDVITFSAWPAASSSVGIEPDTNPVNSTSGANVTFPMATGPGWGTVVYYGLFDDPNSGNYLAGDYLGGYSWIPATMSAGSPGIITAPAHGYLALDPLVVTAKYGGTLPTVTQGTLASVLTVMSAGVGIDTFSVAAISTAVNTLTSGSFLIRKIIQQVVPANVTVFFPASYFVFDAA